MAMPEIVTVEERARIARRDADVARRRSLARRASGPLLEKYLAVVPSVYSARGELAAFRWLVPSRIGLDAIRESAILTLDSAAEALGGFRFGSAGISQAYFPSSRDLTQIEEKGIGERRAGSRFPLSWVPPGVEILFAVIPRELPPFAERDGFRVVTPEFLLRDLIGFYGLRGDLLALYEARIGERRAIGENEG